MTQSAHRLRLSMAASADRTGCALCADGDGASAPSPGTPETAAKSPPERMRVGDLAKRTRVTVRTLHHYEELGLIEPVARSKGHYRLYSEDAESRIRWIGKLKSLGLSLSEIQAVVERRRQSDSAHGAADELQQTYRAKLQDVRDKLQRLAALERELLDSLEYLKECGSECTPSLTPGDCVHCDRHAEIRPNDLITGALL